jgi:hypothetical protein
MALVANDPKAAKRLGIKKSVGEEFLQADKGKKFKGGGMMDKKDLAQDKKMTKKAVGMHEKQLHGGKKSDLAALKKGGKVKKMAMGGPAMPDRGNAGGAMRGLERAAAMSGRTMPTTGRPTGMKKGGSCKGYAKGGGIEVRGKTKGKIC